MRAGLNSPPTKPLIASIEKWASENAEKALKEEVEAQFTAGDWVVGLELYAGGESESRGHSIAVASMRGGMISPHRDIREALTRKSRRYGAIDAPYLIVVADAKDQLFSAETVRAALTEAVFGDEIAVSVGGRVRLDHAKNGFWNGPSGPHNQHVSGVLLLPKAGIWELREPKWQPLLAVNPWATIPPPAELKTISRLEAENGRWTRHTGVEFADLLKVPNTWPPE